MLFLEYNVRNLTVKDSLFSVEKNVSSARQKVIAFPGYFQGWISASNISTTMPLLIVSEIKYLYRLIRNAVLSSTNKTKRN